MTKFDSAAAVAMLRKVYGGPTPTDVATSRDGRYRVEVFRRTDWRGNQTQDELTVRRADCGAALPGGRHMLRSVSSVQWSPKGHTLYVLADGQVWRWTPRTKRLRLWHRAEHGVTAVIPEDEKTALVVEKDSPEKHGPRLRFPRETPMVTLRRVPKGWTRRIEAMAGSFSLSSDGRRMAYTVPATPYPESTFEHDLHLMDLRAGKVRVIGMRGVRACLFTPSSKRPDLLAVTQWPDGHYGKGQDLNIISISRGGIVLFGGDVSYGAMHGWTDDGSAVVASMCEGMNNPVYALGLDGSRRQLVAGRVSHVDHPGGMAITHVPDGEDRLAPIDARPKPRGNFCTQRIVSWKSKDGMPIEGVLIEPRNRRKPWPVMVFVHGGPAGMAGNFPAYYPWLQPLAAAGCAVLVPAFRGSEGYGRRFLKANRPDFARGPLNDCIRGVDYLSRRGLVDRRRAGIFGSSYGGYLTLYALAHSRRFRLGICMNGIFDLASDAANTQRGKFIEHYLDALPWDNPRAYAAHSPSANVAAIQAPLLILHGEADTNTPLSNATEAAFALRRLGKTHRFKTYPGEGHSFTKPQTRLDIVREMVAWMNHYL